MDSSRTALRCPRLAPLAWIERPDAGGFVASDARTGMRMYLGAEERQLCELMNGSRDIDEIAREAGCLLRRPVRAASVARFVEKLGNAGALDGTLPPSPLAGHRPWLHLEADAISARWAARLSPVLGAGGVTVAVVLCVGAAVMFVPHVNSLAPLVALPVWALLSLLLQLLVSMVVHEFAHGIALSSLGERVGAIRFDPATPGLLLSIDVSRVYRLPSRVQRAAVLLSGPAVHVATATAAVLVWWAAEPGTLSALAYCVAVLQYATAALMLFPFVPSDGYYLLAVWFDMPDLGRSAHRLLRLVIRGPRWQRDGEMAVFGPARAAVLLAYAVGAWLVPATLVVTLIGIAVARLGR